MATRLGLGKDIGRKGRQLGRGTAPPLSVNAPGWLPIRSLDYGPSRSERALAGNVPTMGFRSGPAQGQELPAGHHAGFADRYKEAGSTCVLTEGFHTTPGVTVS